MTFTQGSTNRIMEQNKYLRNKPMFIVICFFNKRPKRIERIFIKGAGITEIFVWKKNKP